MGGIEENKVVSLPILDNSDARNNGAIIDSNDYTSIGNEEDNLYLQKVLSILSTEPSTLEKQQGIIEDGISGMPLGKHEKSNAVEDDNDPPTAVRKL